MNEKTPLTAIVVDDEAPARALIREYLSQHSDINVVAECPNGFEAVRAASELKPDLLFLDIQMPKLDGFEVLDLIGRDTASVIFTTAYDEYALRAFDVHAVDYLLKPFDAARFAEALELARSRAQRRDPLPSRDLLETIREGAPLDRVLIRDRSNVHVIPVEQIDYIEAQDDYVSIRAAGRSYLKEQTLGELEEQLAARGFLRIHRRYILNVSRLAKIELSEKDSRIAILNDKTELMIAPALAWSAPAALPDPSIAQIESAYADWLDAVGAVAAIDSGLTTRIADRSRDAWAATRRNLTATLTAALASADRKRLRAADARALRAMRKGFADAVADEPIIDAEHPQVGCADRERSASDAATLQLALYACFEEIGNHMLFEGSSIVRTTALQQLQQLKDGEQRRRLFLAFSPLWSAVNGGDAPDSAYRRMMQMAGVEAQRGADSPIAAASATLGIVPDEAEQWLVQILHAWRMSSGGPPLEPWDYWYASAAASRELNDAVGRGSLLPIAKRFYRDLGADLDRLGVQHDLDVRPGKAPLSYTDLVRMGRRIGNDWRSTETRVSASYAQGGLFVVNELIHEDGHAVHYSALRTRPAYFSLGDDLFFEAFADVPAWSSSEPPWQQKYLGVAAEEGSALRELFSNVVLDAAWGLFELRMFKDPTPDPKAIWTANTTTN